MPSSRARKVALAVGLAAVVSVAGAREASAAEAPTPQAIDANAEFLAYAPPPPVPAKVCVVDTGVDLTTDAAPAVIERHSIFGGTVDDVGGSGLAKHGTLVAGVIASQADGRDSVGIWPQARIVSVRVFAGSGGGTTTAAVITALERCRQYGTLVANISLSGLDQSTGEELARLDNRITTLRSGRGISVVASTGNNGGAVAYPARFPTVVAVGANDGTGALCPFSNRGVEMDITALGCGSQVSWPGGGLGTANGTSYSAPVVTAVLAALRAYRPDLDAVAAEGLLIATTNNGRLDASRAFSAAGLGGLAVGPPPVSASPTSSGTTTPANRPLRANPLAEIGVTRPWIRSATFDRNVLRVRLKDVPDFGTAIFRVDGRSYRRTSPTLRLGLRRVPRRVTVEFEIPGVGRTLRVGVRVRVVKPVADAGRRRLKRQG